MFQIKVHEVIQRAQICKIHFHKLCEPALNCIFPPLEKQGHQCYFISVSLLQPSWAEKQFVQKPLWSWESEWLGAQN